MSTLLWSRYWFNGTKVYGYFGRLVTVTAATERALENIGIGIGRLTTRRSFLWRIYGFSLWIYKGYIL